MKDLSQYRTAVHTAFEITDPNVHLYHKLQSIEIYEGKIQRAYSGIDQEIINGSYFDLSFNEKMKREIDVEKTIVPERFKLRQIKREIIQYLN